DNVDLASGEVISTPTACNQMEASAEAMSMMTPMMIAKAVTLMKKNRVPTIDGKYYAVIHPSVAFDLRNSPGWMEAHKYAAPEELFNGEIGELHGCRFVENVFAPVLDGEYANKAGTVTYATYMFGKDSFGIIDPEAGLQMIIHDKSEIGGPLNQFSTVGFKLETNGATILYPERLLRMMSCSSYSASDTPN
ncbi:MAG: N4-gp56 family major capsid protein, partial [Oscillospiraceae bacterium]|nr:N4-gp56 family major capsid protein [Oscillospiraceae bacterium]